METVHLAPSKKIHLSAPLKLTINTLHLVYLIRPDELSSLDSQDFVAFYIYHLFHL